MKKSPLDPLSYGRATRWKIDFDEEYLASLSPEDKAWLERFCLAEYGGVPTGLHNEDQMRDVWRARRRASRDIMCNVDPLTDRPNTAPHPSAETVVAAIEVRKKYPQK